MHYLLEHHPVNGLCFDGWARALYSASDEFSVYVIRLVKGHQHSHLTRPAYQEGTDASLSPCAAPYGVHNLLKASRGREYSGCARP